MIKKLKDKSYKNLDYLKKKSRLEVLNSKLIDCNFWESSLVKSNFFNTEILNCVFTDSNLSNSIFRDVIIKNSNFSHADISNCDFSKVKLINVNFRDAIYSKKTKWPKNYKIPREIMFELEKYNPFDYRTKLSYSNVKSLSEKKIQLYKKKFDKEEKNTLTYHSVIEKKIIHELTKGKGYYILKNFYSNKDASLAQKIIEKELKKKKIDKIKKNFSIDKKNKSINVHGLLNLHNIFRKMIKPKEVMNAFKKLMGEDFISTWYAAQCSLSGCRGQSLHLDYPYVSHNIPGEKIPNGMGSKDFLFSCGVLTFLNEYDKDYKGPILLENSHKLRKFPTIQDLKKNNFTYVKVPRGSILIINTLLWHAGMPNYSKKKDRHLIVAHYTPKFIKLRYDLLRETNKTFLKKDKFLKQLLDYE